MRAARGMSLQGKEFGVGKIFYINNKASRSYGWDAFYRMHKKAVISVRAVSNEGKSDEEWKIYYASCLYKRQRVRFRLLLQNAMGNICSRNESLQERKSNSLNIVKRHWSIYYAWIRSLNNNVITVLFLLQNANPYYSKRQHPVNGCWFFIALADEVSSYGQNLSFLL